MLREISLLIDYKQNNGKKKTKKNIEFNFEVNENLKKPII